MSILLAVATVLSTQIPEAAVDRTWGPLMRADHFAGDWRIHAADRDFAGDRVVVDREVTNSRFGTRRWLHFVGETSYCAIGIDEGRLYCEDAVGQIDRIVPSGLAIPSSHTLDIVVDRMVCAKGSCQQVRDGMVRGTLRPKQLTGAVDGYNLFARIHGRSLDDALGATWNATRSVQLTMPYRIVTRGSGTAKRYAQTVIEAKATLTFGPNPRAVIEAVEVARYVEDCDNPHADMAASSCGYYPPICVRRSAAATVIPGDAKLRPTPAAARR